MKHARLSRLRTRILPYAAAVICSAIVLLVGTMPASAAPGSHSRMVTFTVKVDRVTALSPGEQPEATALCRPALDKYNRTQVCWEQILTFTFFVNEEPVGTLIADLVQSISLKAIGRSWTEHDTIAEAVPAGTTAPVEAVLGASCNSPCHATAHFAGVIETGLTGTVDYTDAVAKGHAHTTLTHYTLDYDAPPYIPDSVGTWDSPLSYRCDDELPGQGAGCIFPKYTPTLTSMTSLPAIAANIRRIQNKGPGHYGRPGSGHPLHRLVNPKKQRANYNAVCSRRVVGPPPKPGLSCDEYPFRSTQEGGTALSKANRGTAWVPKKQQDSQGGLIRSFYYSNRVLNDDPFYVEV
jgi:hypothetical protein